MILGLDPATNFGWSVMDDTGAVIASGTWDLRQPIPKVARGTLFLRLETKLNELIGAHDGVETLAYERVFQHTSEAQHRMYGGCVGVIEMAAASWEIKNLAAIAIPTVKLHATGSGRAEKHQMLAAARARWGDRIKDDNEADACWIADAVRLGKHIKAEAAKKRRKTA